MVKNVSFEEAQKSYINNYENGKHSKSISICDKLHKEYKQFCFNQMDMQDMSYRIRILMIRDMLENTRD